MTPRFRMVAGPNGSGKTTLCGMLAREFAVNFYEMVNADDLFATATKTLAIPSPLPLDAGDLDRHLRSSSYPATVLRPFRSGAISLSGDCFRFRDKRDVTTYTVSLVANFLQERLIAAGQSFSQETVFSHPSKVDALRAAKERWFRTYLYFVATENPAINAFRVLDRVEKGGHGVPPDKIVSRYDRSLANVAPALPWLSRAFFFDNSGPEFRFVAEYDETAGFTFVADDCPSWFRRAIPETPSLTESGAKHQRPSWTDRRIRK